MCSGACTGGTDQSELVTSPAEAVTRREAEFNQLTSKFYPAVGGFSIEHVRRQAQSNLLRDPHETLTELPRNPHGPRREPGRKSEKLGSRGELAFTEIHHQSDG